MLLMVGGLSSRPAAARLDTIAGRAEALADLLAEMGRPGHASAAGNIARAIRAVAGSLG